MLIGYQNANAQGTDRDKISSAMMHLLNEWDRDAYTGILDLIAQVLDYDAEELVVNAQQKLAGMKTPNGDTYRLTLDPTAFFGNYAVVNKRWVRQGDADNIKLTFPDRQGNECVAIVTLSGEKKSFTTHDVEVIDESDLEKYKEKSEKIYNIMKGFAAIANGVTELTIVMQENVDVSFTQGGKEMLHANVNLDLSGIKDDEWNLLEQSLKKLSSAPLYVDETPGLPIMEFPGTFDLTLNKTGYMPGMGLNLDFTAKKGDKQLVAAKLSAPGTFTGISETLDFGLQSLNVDIDVMGEIQAKGGAADLTAFIQALVMGRSMASASPVDLSQQFAINIYYDNQPEVKGIFTLVLAPNADGDVKLAPVINFTSDGSTNVVTNYFTTANFPEVRAKVEEIYTDAKGLIEIIKQKAGLASGIYRLMSKESETQEDGLLNLLGQKAASRPGVYLLKTESGVKKVMKK